MAKPKPLIFILGLLILIFVIWNFLLKTDKTAKKEFPLGIGKDLFTPKSNFDQAQLIKSKSKNIISVEKCIKKNLSEYRVKKHKNNELFKIDDDFIKDTIIYEADKNQELCLISNFGKKNKLIDNKSILKIYSL